MTRKPLGTLRRGWTTGACATAATKAALEALWSGRFANCVTITLPKGEMPVFALEHCVKGEGWAEVGIIKDAGDDPDVTHGALVIVRVLASKNGIIFKAGAGVGTVSKAGLPLDVGDPAINPKPREFMRAVVKEMALKYNQTENIEIVISIPNGEKIAKKTWNGRLGIIGGLSILGTTGIVRPFSCAAWIASIHRGIDVARANNLEHVAACTGATSERIVQEMFDLPDHAMLDMGDFSGGLLKYIAKHPVKHLTIGGGIGKITKLAQGAVDLHSSRSQVDFVALNKLSKKLGLVDISHVNTALEAVEIAGNGLAKAIAEQAQKNALKQVKSGVKYLDVIVIDRAGKLLGKS